MGWYQCTAVPLILFIFMISFTVFEVCGEGLPGYEWHALCFGTEALYSQA